MKPLRSYIAIANLCLPALLVNAQRKHTVQPSSPPAHVKATVDRQTILIGEPFHLQLEATVPDNTPFAWAGLDSMPHFDWLEKGKIDTTVRPGERSYRQDLTVTSWDSGAWAIPRLPFLAANKKVFTDSIRILVNYTKLDPSKDYHDIKDIVDVPNPLARYFVWFVVLVTLVSIGVIFLIIRRRHLLAQPVVAPAPRLSPYEEALQQLDELERQRLPEKAAFKVYYSRLGEILRLYLLRRLGISSFAETSEELIGQLRRQGLPKDIFDSLSETLRMGDFVKFAKYQPVPSDSVYHYQAIRSAIDAMEAALAPQPVAETTN
jgi:hypothetical protein